MPLKLDIKKKLSSRSDRVKVVELHPTQPWVMSGLYNGNIMVHDYNTQTVLKSFEVSNSPVRCACFVARQQWIVVGSDDKCIRVYNYNTLEKVKTFDAHDDFLRHLIVHPTLPYILTSSDDCFVKLWNWEQNWTATRTYEGHSHYVMQIALNPKDFNTFATCSLDRSIKVWGISGSEGPHFSLQGHTQGVNCLNYYPGGDKPYLVSGGDDMMVKVWDYTTKQCIASLEGHHNNIASVSFHPDLPLIVSCAEDSAIKLWHSQTFRLEMTLNYSMERVWTHSTLQGSKLLAVGCDEGTLVLKLGSEEPLASMTSAGVVIWAKANEILAANLRIGEEDIKDGEIISLVPKERDTIELFPQSIKISPNGRSVAICGDGEYLIKSSRAFRNQGYGSAIELVWSTAYAGDFAVREQNRIRKVRGEEETFNFRPGFTVETLFGGFLIGVRGEDSISFFEWDKGALVRRIDVCPKQVYWSDSGSHVALVIDDNYFILQFKRESLQQQADEEGLSDSFVLEHEVIESVVSAIWLSECFLYTTSSHKLNYCIGGKVHTLVHLDKRYYILGFLPQQNRIYLIDSDYKVVSYEVMLGFIEYQIAVVNEDFERVEQIFPSLPVAYHNKCAKFLDGLGFKDEAYAITLDPDHKFDLALQLNNLEDAYDLAKAEQKDPDSKWKMVGDLALLTGNVPLAESCMKRSKDLNGLLLIYSSLGLAGPLEELAEQAEAGDKLNIAFTCRFMLKQLDKCVAVLIKSKRIPEAALFARTYCPSLVQSVVLAWRSELAETSSIAAQSLADPTAYPQLFPEMKEGLKAEAALRKHYALSSPASSYAQQQALLDLDILSLARENEELDLQSYLDAAPECPDDPFSQQ
jgi:coatomer subunit beta'